MPLHCYYKMIRGSSLDCFNNSIIRTASHNTQPLANRIRGLMMR